MGYCSEMSSWLPRQQRCASGFVSVNTVALFAFVKLSASSGFGHAQTGNNSARFFLFVWGFEASTSGVVEERR